MGHPIEYELGEFLGRRYFLWADAEPDYDRPESFVANVHYETSESRSNVEIVRIDTEHCYTHVHQFYREHQPTVAFEGGIWEAMTALRTNWREYARRYQEYHER